MCCKDGRTSLVQCSAVLTSLDLFIDTYVTFTLPVPTLFQPTLVPLWKIPSLWDLQEPCCFVKHFMKHETKLFCSAGCLHIPLPVWKSSKYQQLGAPVIPCSHYTVLFHWMSVTLNMTSGLCKATMMIRYNKMGLTIWYYFIVEMQQKRCQYEMFWENGFWWYQVLSFNHLRPQLICL